MVDDIQKYPEGAFVLAAIVALQEGQWWKAEEFASYAVSASGRNAADLNHEEARFLLALAKRFRFASLQEPMASQSNDSTYFNAVLERRSRVWSEAEAIISQAIDSSSIDTHAAGWLRTRRAYSERAAVRLFSVASEIGTSGSTGGRSSRWTQNTLERAQADLCEAQKLKGAVPAEMTEQDARISAQLRNNSVALQVLRFLIEPSAQFKVDDRLRSELISAAVSEELTTEFFPSLKSQKLFCRIALGQLDDWNLFLATLNEPEHEELAVDRAIRTALRQRREVIYEIFEDQCLKKKRPAKLHAGQA